MLVVHGQATYFLRASGHSMVGAGTNAHPRAPLALAGGLALSYAVIGTGLAWAGSALDLDASIFRNVGAAILGLLGLVLMSGSL